MYTLCQDHVDWLPMLRILTFLFPASLYKAFGMGSDVKMKSIVRLFLNKMWHYSGNKIMYSGEIGKLKYEMSDTDFTELFEFPYNFRSISCDDVSLWSSH
jgi:hypothetical protein